MKAIILAAGRGKRLKPITNSTPKPLVKVNGTPLLQRHIEKLKQAGISEIIINVSWLRTCIVDFLLKNNNFGVNIVISDEGDQALETGGGIKKALPLIGTNPFLAVNGDIYTDFNFRNIQKIAENDLISLVMVNNPTHNLNGDFHYKNNRLVTHSKLKYTYSGIGVLRPELFSSENKNSFSVTPLLKQCIQNNQASAQLYTGIWNDVGTVERLDALNRLK